MTLHSLLKWVGVIIKHVINEKWYKGRKDSIEDEAERIFAADTLLKANKGEQEYDTELYPRDIDTVDFDNGKLWIPHLLQKLLDIIIPSCQLKQTSIDQAIVQAARPRSVITPILFVLGVEMDHVFGSLSGW